MTHDRPLSSEALLLEAEGRVGERGTGNAADASAVVVASGYAAAGVDADVDVGAGAGAGL